jgi:hypothetical protein
MPLHGRHWHYRRPLNWWIGILFALGASLFALGGVLVLFPVLAQRWSLDVTAVNTVFFAGSIPFTTAAYLQLFQAANVATPGPTPASGRRREAWLGWRPGDLGWLACALQFAGTLLFNLNTYDAMATGMDWLQQDVLVWSPDMVGSALFLAAGYLAFIETSLATGWWGPGRLSWWVAVVNLVGCVAFMISAVLAYVPVSAAGPAWLVGATWLTVIGAVAFGLGGLLLLPGLTVAR